MVSFRVVQTPLTLVCPMAQAGLVVPVGVGVGVGVGVTATGALVPHTDPPPATSNFCSRHTQPEDMFCPSRQACPALGVAKQRPLAVGRIGRSHRQPFESASLLEQARPAPPVGVDVAIGVGVGTGVAVDTGVGVGVAEMPIPPTLSGTHLPILPPTRYVVPTGHP